MSQNTKQFFISLIIFNIIFIFITQLFIINPPDFLKTKKIKKIEAHEKR